MLGRDQGDPKTTGGDRRASAAVGEEQPGTRATVSKATPLKPRTAQEGEVGIVRTPGLIVARDGLNGISLM
jgi:hypothetical protein